jgi:hypothetical protein
MRIEKVKNYGSKSSGELCGSDEIKVIKKSGG